jgi:hypothetical protein
MWLNLCFSFAATTAFVTVSASKFELPAPVFAWITDDTVDGTPTLPDENVSREIGPECSFDAAVMAESVDGARADPSLVSSATTRVDCERCSSWWWNAPRQAARRAKLIEEVIAGRGSMVNSDR